VFKELIKLANHLDSKGFVKEAGYLDRIIKAANKRSAYSDIKDQYGNAILHRLIDMGYTPLKGMEGPFMMNGWIAYYDRMEGEYYNRDSDMYYSALGIDVTQPQAFRKSFTNKA
tara:strand:- start:2142 stop:2483 length:342 start_codon:yes stop_codon:yes gene_type:complete